MKYEFPLLEGSRSFTRINQWFDAGMDKEIVDLKSKLGDKEEQLDNAKKELEKPFLYEKELKEKTARFEALDLLISPDENEMKRNIMRQRSIGRGVGVEL